MKLRQISFKLVSLVMVLAILFSVSATTISAAAQSIEHDHTEENTDEKIYVSLGDSMTNGYGLPGYEEWNENTQDFDNYFGFLVNTPDAYPNQVAEAFGWDLIQLATSGLRADDIYYLLNYGTEYEVEWDEYGKLYMADKFDNTFSGTDDEVISQAAAAYQEAIKKADVISVNVGSNNFATLMHLRMSYLLGLITGNTFMFGGYNGEFNFSELVGNLEPEVRAQIVEIYEELKAELFAYAEESGVPTDFVLNEENGITLGYVLEDLANAAAYTTAGFAIGYAGILDTINRENSDAEVIIVELTNWFAGQVFSIPAGDGVINIPVGDIFDSLYDFASVYMSAVATGYTVDDKINETAVQTIYFANVDNYVELIVDQIVSNSNIDLEALYEIKDEDARFEAAKVIAESIDYTMIPDGSVRARLLSFLGSYVLSNFGITVPTYAQVQAADKVIEYYYSDEFTVDIGYGPMDRAAFEGVFASFEDCGGTGVHNTPYCQTCIGCPLNMYLGMRPDVTNIVGCMAYLGLEKSMIASLSVETTNVNDLLIAADFNTLMETSQKALEGHMGGMDDVAAAMIASPELITVSKMLFSFMVGDGAILHPSVNGHKTIANAIIEAYEGEHTALDETVENVIKYAEIIADYIAENYEQIYADVHTELREQGIIDEFNNYVDIALDAIASAKAELELVEMGERFEYSKSLMIRELTNTELTLNHIKALVNEETINPNTFVLLNELLLDLEAHAETLGSLGIELATISNEQLMVAVAELQAQAEKQLAILYAELETAVGEARDAILAEIAKIQAHLESEINDLVNKVNALKAAIDNAVNSVIDTVEYGVEFTTNFVHNVYTYIYNKAPETYEQLVNALVDAIAVYSHEAAKLAYNWLINNPETVIAFFDTYGDDIAKFFVDNHEVIFGVLGYVGMTYGEDILCLVLDNADVILPAIAGWFEIHGDLVWDLIVVYFNAIVEYYNLGLDLDFSTPDGIHASLNKIFSLLGELLSMIADGIYDLADALNLIDELEAALAALDAQIRYQIETVLGQIDAHVAEKIALITAQINKQIETLKAQAEKQLAILYAQLETAVGAARDAILAEIARIEAELEAQIAALEAQLEALIQAEINNAEDLAVALGALLEDGAYALGQFIYDAITAYVNDAIRGEFTPNEETVYVSVSSGDDYYAQLLAAALSDMAKSEITAESTVWGDLDYDLLASADLVTIGYSATELNEFAIAQLFGYVKEFIDNDIRNSGLDYVESVFAGFHSYIDGLNASLGEYGNIELDTSKEEAYVYGEINTFVDGLIGAGELSDEHYELMGDYGVVALFAGMFFADATLEELDWAKYVGEDNLHYVDNLRAAIRSELVKQGVMDNYVIEVPVLDYALNSVFGDSDYITYQGVTIKRAMLEKHLEGAENYTIAIPVVDSLVFAIESYIYSNVAFNYQYGELIVDLYKTNPDVTIVLLGQYNAFDYEIDVLGEYIDLGALYTYVAQINSVQPFAYALLSENVAYVDISDAETYYESFLNEGTDDSLLNFVLNFVLDPSITDLSEAGHEYVYEQIMNVLTLNCDHVYDNACDATCNKCGELREVADHVYVDGECIYCGAIDPDYVPDIPDAPTHNFHVFDDCYDTTCNECDYVRVAIGHVFDDCEDATCYMCDYVRDEVPGHLFGNCGEDTCSRCGKTRPATVHVYNNACDADCNRCGETREVPAHVYSGCTDATCNVCGAEREASAHTISNKCTDNICDVCGQNVAVNGHVFGAWTVTVEPTRKTEGKQTRTCTGCGLVETATIDALGGIGGGAIAAIVTGSTAVTGAGGFGIYWFLIQKKTFAQLLAALGKGAVATAAVATEAAAEAGVAAEAGAVAAEAAAEATAEATAEAVAEAAAETIAE